MNQDTLAGASTEQSKPVSDAISFSNGAYFDDAFDVPIEILQTELPVVHDGQIPLGDLLSRVVQSIYAELSELAETMPNMSDTARKRMLADWVVKIKKQVVKLYAVAKWSRDADTIQKCMNITAFLMTQNQQFEDAIKGINYGKDSLDSARLRNHDLLTSLDVLTKGSYLRLPTCIKKVTTPQPLLTDAQVQKTLVDVEEAIRYRLRMSELIPVEMSQYEISHGRVHFTVDKLFKCSLCLRGSAKEDGWFFVSVEFLINIGGDITTSQEFPRIPTGLIKRHIIDEADARLAFYLPLPADEHHIPDMAPRPQLPANVIDAPLIRIFNFLQMMSLSYQLEILWFQAQRMRSLGWADYLNIDMSPDRKCLKATYWKFPRSTNSSLPSVGGTLIIMIKESKTTRDSNFSGGRNFKQKAVSRLQQKAKIGAAKPSDDVEALGFVVKWEPAQGAHGVLIPPEDCTLPPKALEIDADDLDFEKILRLVIRQHSKAILSIFYNMLSNPVRTAFSVPGMLELSLNDDLQTLRVALCSDEVAILSIDARTGRINARDSGDLISASRGSDLKGFVDHINIHPTTLIESLIRLRVATVIRLAEQKTRYLGLQSYRRRHAPIRELEKLGRDMQGTLFIPLALKPTTYLILIATEDRFKYALVNSTVHRDSENIYLVFDDVAWLDVSRIHASDFSPTPEDNDDTLKPSGQQGTGQTERYMGFNLDTQGLRELYNYCCARVAYMTVERQLKNRGIPVTHVHPSFNMALSPQMMQIQSSLARSVPALCVQSKDILSGAPAAEAAMPNIRVIPLNWWSDEPSQVVTCVKLKYVQQPLGKTAIGSTVIRPSKRIIYDTREAVVCFLSENVQSCVDEFLEEWARVSKMVVIAREVAQMAKRHNWEDTRLLSFDLQTVEFAYARDYSVLISCPNQLSSTGGKFDLEFSRIKPQDAMDTDTSDFFNPHEDAAPFLRDILQKGHGRLSQALYILVKLLRETLPIVEQLETIRKDSWQKGRHLDIFAKASGWYRLSYGDQKYALDFRLMTGQRVAIVDASRSLFDLPSERNAPQKETPFDNLLLKPIPNFKSIVTEVVQQGYADKHLTPGKVAAVDIGVVCDSAGVAVLTKGLHSRILEQLPPQ
ncbi:hypothetical protein CVT24_004100 [Panaeolus cyanescens]|uniref:Mediator of RNA polymerase II transcription subunit 14 n=1 Tax=Panaeolus cyanescens TaxID=181874 RepID=A0A409Y649_9AGAR|nr:hypothetical protein CVT24_004100 [Panaeolus cyanescens]